MLKLDFSLIATTGRGEPLQKQLIVDGVPQRYPTGDPILVPTGDTFGAILADELSNSSSKASRKRFGWARSLYADSTLLVDGQDFDDLFEFVEASGLRDFIKCPLLEIMTTTKQK